MIDLLAIYLNYQKTLEKVIAKQLLINGSCEPYIMSDIYQFTYRKHHSKEAELLSVTNDIKFVIYSKKGTVLVILDFGSEFDTILPFNFTKYIRTMIWYNASFSG